MRSKEIADLAGVTVRTLRHYRKIGLLREPERAENGYCEYTVDDLVRLLRIKTLSSLGFSLDDIARMLDADGAKQEGATYDEKLDELDRELALQIERLEEKRRTVARLRAEGISPDMPLRAGRVATYDEKLDELDRELALQIERLEEKRRTVARLRAEGISPDMPLRAGRVLSKLIDVRPASALEEIDETGLLLAANLYADEDFEEIDKFCTALIERDLIEEYRHASKLLENLDETSDEQEQERVASEMIALLTKVIDCFDAKNWDRPATEAEKIIDEYAQEALNPVQELVSNRILDVVYGQIMKRSSTDG